MDNQVEKNEEEVIQLNPIQRDRSNTEAVIEKFTNIDGEVDVNKMASKMSDVTNQNYTFKKIFLFSSLLLVVMVGLMISANIIGALFLRDSKVKDDQLVTSRSNIPISMDVKLYSVPVYLFTPDDVLAGLKYVEVPVVTEQDSLNATLHLRINSYINVPGKQVIFIGEKYSLIIQRHNYELILNNGSFDPLALNTTDTNDVNEVIDNSNQTVKRVFNSAPDTDGKKNVHPTLEKKKRHEIEEVGGEDPTEEFVVLNGKGTVSAPSLTRSSTSNLLYRSGKIVTNGTIVIIVWNDQTNGNFGASNLKTCYNNLPTFYSDLLKTKLFTQLTPGKKGSDPQCHVRGLDSNVHYLTPSSTYKKQTLADSDIGNQLKAWLSVPYDASKVNSTIPKDASNPLNYMYMIFFPSGIKLSSGFCSSYCGFHTYTNNYAYAVMPWVGDCISACGSSSYVSSFGGSTCGSLHSVAAHEAIEMATDPYLNVYYDSSGNECADKCAWTSPACYKNPSTGNSYCIQQQWNHTASSSTANDAGCSKNLQF